MLSADLRAATPATDLSAQFELLVGDMGGITGIGVPMVIVEKLPDMPANGRAMVHVPLEGDLFSEAIAVKTFRYRQRSLDR